MVGEMKWLIEGGFELPKRFELLLTLKRVQSRVLYDCLGH
jgi:hypothetical protein